MDPTIQLLCDLVAIDSVNPTLVPGGAGEARIAEYIAAYLNREGLEVTVREAAPGRPNVTGRLRARGTGRGRSLLLCGHMDTVGVEGMKAPFTPEIRDGRVYGRGAQDMKGGLAAALAALVALAHSGGRLNGDVMAAAVADEEHSSIGAEALVTTCRADGAVVTEPTDLTLVTAHKGFVWLEVETRGRAAHGSRPAEGIDAIAHMGRVLGALEALDRRLQDGPRHPLLATGSLHASTISGGREWSSYPDFCRLQVERRTVPGETVQRVAGEVRQALAALAAADPYVRAELKVVFARSPLELDAAHPLPSALAQALGQAGRPTACAGTTFWTDAAILAEAGIPSVNFGPGGAGLHSVEEYVRIEEVQVCRDLLISLARRFCS